MLVSTGIMFVTLAVAVFIFRPRWLDLAMLALLALFSTALVFLFLKAQESSREKTLREKCEDASDIV
jgi:membrane protein implicated in regulation of membrane protease activity